MGLGETVPYVRTNKEAGWGAWRTGRRPGSGSGRRTGTIGRASSSCAGRTAGSPGSAWLSRPRDEEATVGDVVGAIAAAFMTCKPLVDELVVMDSGSRDRTAEVAARAGATVYRCREVAEGLGAYPGKGEALWKSLQVTTGDILVFLDADLTRWGTHFVTGLLGLLLDPAQQTLLVKACYDRAGDGQPTAAGSRNWWRARS
jgi:hypothetical protein